VWWIRCGGWVWASWLLLRVAGVGGPLWLGLAYWASSFVVPGLRVCEVGWARGGVVGVAGEVVEVDVQCSWASRTFCSLCWRRCSGGVAPSGFRLVCGCGLGGLAWGWAKGYA